MLPDGTEGITDASTTRNPSTPITLRFSSTTEPIHHDAAVIARGGKVGADRGRRRGIAGADLPRAARFGLELRYRGRESRMRVQRPAALRAREIDEVDLRVGALRFGPGAHERG